MLVDKERPGGVCLNWGCIPTKAMLRSAEVLETVRHGAEYGVVAENVRLDYSVVRQRKQRAVKGLTDGVAMPAWSGRRRSRWWGGGVAVLRVGQLTPCSHGEWLVGW